MQMLFPDEFDFYPKTWFLPEQLEKFQKDVHLIHTKDRKCRRSPTTFIVKPSDGSEGSGIYLIQDPTRCNVVNRPHIVQEYIDRPLLIDALKFDMRIYVLILKLDPLKIFLYDEGLVRFATINYQAPTSKNLHEAFMHLTNYSLNKRSATYKHAVDEKQTNASKRKLSTVWSQMDQSFSLNEIEHVQDMIKELIIKTIIAILPELRTQYALELPASGNQNRCFQIIGFDIILTNQLKPILLEVNANPSLRIDFERINEAGKLVHEPSPIDEEIKKSLVLETLKLVMKHKWHCRRSKPDDQNMTRETRDVDNQSSEEGDEIDETQMQLISKIDMERRVQSSSSVSDEDKCILPTVENLLDTRDNGNVVQSLVNRTSMKSVTPIMNSAKSLVPIFSSTSQTEYEQMFLVEKIAFIYIELVVKRGYKAMTNWSFRNLAKICGIIDQSTTMAIIDMLYIQLFQKCKEYGSQSPATGLQFSGFVEAFFLLAQRRYPNDNLLESVTEMVKVCSCHLNLASAD